MLLCRAPNVRWSIAVVFSEIKMFCYAFESRRKKKKSTEGITHSNTEWIKVREMCGGDMCGPLVSAFSYIEKDPMWLGHFRIFVVKCAPCFCC